MIFVVGVMIMKRKHNKYNKMNVRIVYHTALQIEFRLSALLRYLYVWAIVIIYANIYSLVACMYNGSD